MSLSYLSLETSGDLILQGGDPLLLESSDMSQYEEWQLFALDYVEEEFKRILIDAISTPAAPVQVLMRRESSTQNTPRVLLTLQTQQNQSSNHIISPNVDVRLQPRDVWFYTLSAEVSTNRAENGSQHLPLCGKVRLALQYYKLAGVWSLPLQTIIDIMEAPIELSIDESGNIDSTKLVFTGQLCIRRGAWNLI